MRSFFGTLEKPHRKRSMASPRGRTAPRLIYSTATVRGWWLPRWVGSQPLAEVRAATSDLLTMLSNGALTPPAIGRYSFKDFQEAVRLADGEAGQQKVLLDFSERAP